MHGSGPWAPGLAGALLSDHLREIWGLPPLKEERSNPPLRSSNAACTSTGRDGQAINEGTTQAQESPATTLSHLQVPLPTGPLRAPAAAMNRQIEPSTCCSCRNTTACRSTSFNVGSKSVSASTPSWPTRQANPQVVHKVGGSAFALQPQAVCHLRIPFFLYVHPMRKFVPLRRWRRNPLSFPKRSRQRRQRRTRKLVVNMVRLLHHLQRPLLLSRMPSSEIWRQSLPRRLTWQLQS